MKVVVATRNKDKFFIVENIIESIFTDIRLEALHNTNMKGDVLEIGTIEERAAHKAQYFLERLDNEADNYDAVLGIDDGIAVAKEEATPHSKEITDQILQGRWPVETPISIWRAYALAQVGELTRVEVTIVPFEYKGNKNNISREDGKYPLSYVLGPVGANACVSDLSEAETNSYNLEHSKDALFRLFA